MFSRYSCYSECLPLNVMVTLNMMLYWTGSGRLAIICQCVTVLQYLPCEVGEATGDNDLGVEYL